jgi:hypothetical protein
MGKKPATKRELEAIIARTERRMQEHMSPAEFFKTGIRRVNELRRRASFISSAMKAGFTRRQAKFMLDHLALKEHEHWDGRVGG